MATGRSAAGRGPLLRGALLVFLGVVVVTGGFRLLLPDDLARNESTDVTTVYAPVAERLLDGDGLTTPDGEPSVRYPPGHPVLLAVSFGTADLVGASHHAAATGLTLVSAGLAGVLLWAVARQVFDPLVAAVAVGLWTLHPLHLWLAKQPNSELPFEVLLYASVLACTPALRGRGTWRHAAAAGALLATATLVRPAGLALVVPVAVVLWASSRGDTVRERTRTVAALVLAFLLVLLPWSWWASTQAGHPVLVADAVSVNVVEGLTLGAETEGELDQMPLPDAARAVARDAQEDEARLQDGGELRSFLAEQARDRPVALGQLIVIKAARAFFGTDSGRWEPAVGLLQVATVAAALLGGWWTWSCGGPGRRYVALVAGMVLTSWATTIAVDSIVRHQVPTLGLAMPLVAVAVVGVGRRAAPRAGGTPRSGGAPPGPLTVGR